jgi:ribose transport system substrate-binding protein
MTTFSTTRSYLLALVAAVALVGAGCGSDDAETPASAPAATEEADAGASESTIVADSAALIERALAGPVYSDKAEIDATPADLQPVTDWTGPTEVPEVPQGKNIQIIVCLVGTSCQFMGDAAAEAARELGWTAEIIDGKGTPQGANDAFNAALTKKPDAILTIAIPETQVADKVARAKEAGIKMVGISSISENVPDGYDAYVSLKETLTAKMQAWWAIADSGGKANVVIVWDKGYPHLNQALEGVEQVFAQCDGCKVLQVYKRTLASSADPVAMGQLTNSILQKHGSQVDYILTPYGFGVAPMSQRVEASGREVKLLSKNADPLNLGLVSKGTQAADFGSSLEWSGWAGIDQTIRVLASEEPIADAEQGMPVRAYDKDNAPADGNVDWTKPVDFKVEYRKVWGVG